MRITASRIKAQTSWWMSIQCWIIRTHNTLSPLTGKKEDILITRADPRCKPRKADGCLQLICIEQEIGLKAHCTQRGGHGLRIIASLLKRGDMGIVINPDYQSMSGMCEGRFIVRSLFKYL